MEKDGIPGNAKFYCNSLGFSTVGEVLAARWRPRNAFLAPQGAPRAHFSESYKKIMKNHGTSAKIAMFLCSWCNFVYFTQSS